MSYRSVYGNRTTLKTEDQLTTGDAKLPPFAREWVTLTKQEHTQLVWEANDWKSAYQCTNARLQEIEARHQLELEQAATRETALGSELEVAQAKVRDLRKRVFGRKSEHSSHEDNTREPDKKTSRPRGQQRGAPGHGRTSACPRTTKPSRLIRRSARAAGWITPTSPAPKTAKYLRLRSKPEVSPHIVY